MKKLLSFSVLVLCLAMSRAQTPSSMEEVYNILQNRCVSCHSHNTPAANLDLEGAGATPALKVLSVYQKIVNRVPANAQAAAKGDKLIYPGRPDRSFLFRKINQGFEETIAALDANEGNAMPGYPNNGAPEAKEKEVIRQWILYGARSTGTLFSRALVEQWYDDNGIKSFPDGPPPAPAPGEGFQIKMGPFYLAPDGEVEYFQKYELKLPADVEVNRVDIKIGGYSHHYLIYNFGSPAGANAVPHGLRTNANHFDINLVAAVQEQTDLRLPETTAFKWKKDIILDLNSHYINYSLDRPYQAEAYVNVYTQPVGTAAHQMFATLLVNDNIPIPNSGNLITHTAPEFAPGADSLYVWGMMGHTHKYGTGYKVWKRQRNGQKGELLYDAGCADGLPGCPSPLYDYRHIPMRYWQPLYPIKWSNGIVHEATWINEGPSSVNFGATSDDEMMVLIVFYTEDPVVLDAPEPASPLTLRVFPNPAGERLSFALQTPQNQANTLRLFDVAGREVLRRDNIGQREFSVDVAALPPGIYFFNLDGQTGRVVLE